MLTVLFLISYGIMTMLIVEQGATIESQRALIRELFKDSAELSAARKSALATAQATAQAPAAKTPASPSAQAPAKQAPSSETTPQSAPQHRIQSQQKSPFQMPSRPASDLTDDRRALIRI